MLSVGIKYFIMRVLICDVREVQSCDIRYLNVNDVSANSFIISPS